MIFGRHPVVEALRTRVPIEKILVAYGTKPATVLQEIRALAADAGVPVEHEARRRLDQLSSDGSHQGVIAFVPEFSYVDREALVHPGLCRLILLDGITDPANVGSILRSAEAFGWTGMLLPRHRAAGVTSVVRKVAAGAAERVPVAKTGSAAETISRLQNEQVWVIGLDPGGEVTYFECDYPERICLVVGAEGRGLSRLVRERCDALVAIPMHGALASINAAVATAIVMAEEARRRPLQ